MSRPVAFALSCCAALIPPAAGATDSSTDSTFAPGSSTPGWVRSFVTGGGFADERIVAAARAPDGGYVLAGSRAGGAQGALIFLAKFKANGSYDTAFGGTAATGNAGIGRVLKDAWLSSVADMTVDAQGRIVVVGNTPGALGQSDFGIVRFKPDGSDDTSFAGDGGTSVAFDLDTAHGRANDVPGSVTTTPDGSIFVAGTIETNTTGAAKRWVGAVKLKPDGSRDQTFGALSGGREYYNWSSGDNVLSVVRIVYDAPRATIAIGGDLEVGANNTDWFIITHQIWSINSKAASYAIDLGGNSGYQLAYMTDLAVQPDGKPVAVGWANDANVKATPVLLRRLALSTNEDTTSFGNIAGRGMAVLWSWTDSVLNGLAFDSRGRILVAGEYAPFKAGIAARLGSDGAIDASFNGTTSPSAYFAKTSSLQSSWTTSFKRVFIDAGRAVLAGEAPDSNTAATDYDLVMTRLQSDLIFANGYE